MLETSGEKLKILRQILKAVFNIWRLRLFKVCAILFLKIFVVNVFIVFAFIANYLLFSMSDCAEYKSYRFRFISEGPIADTVWMFQISLQYYCVALV